VSPLVLGALALLAAIGGIAVVFAACLTATWRKARQEAERLRERDRPGRQAHAR